MDFTNLNKQRKFIMIAAAVGIISVFLPWLSVSLLGISENGLHGFGIMALLGFGAAAGLSFTGDQTQPLDKSMWLAALIAGAVSVLCSLLYMSGQSELTSQGASYGFGLWISILAALGVIASAWMFKNPGDSIQSGFDSLKTKVTESTAHVNTSSASAPAPAATLGVSKVEELEKLIKLKEDGKISEEEYQQMKAKL